VRNRKRSGEPYHLARDRLVTELFSPIQLPDVVPSDPADTRDPKEPGIRATRGEPGNPDRVGVGAY